MMNAHMKVIANSFMRLLAPRRALAWTSIAFGVAVPSASAFAAPPGVTPAVFDDFRLLEMTVSAPLDQLFKKAATLPSSYCSQSNDTEAAFVAGSISFKDPNAGPTTLPVQIRVRGNSSKKDCPFPKLTVQIDKSADTKSTIFAGVKSFKIGTHCADVEGNSGSYKRLRNQLSPNREALAYRMLEALGVATLKARPGRITYVNTDSQRTLIRNGMILETTGALEKRLGVEEIFPANTCSYAQAAQARQQKGLPPPPAFVDAAKDSDPIELTMAYFAHPIIGSSDWDLIVEGRTRRSDPARYSLWNMMAFVRPNGSKFFVPYDFDLAAFVIWPEKAATDSPAKALEVLSPRPEILKSFKAQVRAQKNAVRSLIKNWDFSYVDIASGKLREDKDARSAMLGYMDSIFLEIEHLGGSGGSGSHGGVFDHNK